MITFFSSRNDARKILKYPAEAAKAVKISFRFIILFCCIFKIHTQLFSKLFNKIYCIEVSVHEVLLIVDEI